MQRQARRWLVGICAVAVCLRLPVFCFPYVNIDENEYRLAAQILLQGGLPYRDFLIYQPPVIYYLYAFAFWLFQTDALWAAHIMVIGTVVATCGILYAIGVQLADRATGLWAAGCYALFTTTFFPEEMLGANCEVVLTLPICVAVWCVVRWMRRSEASAHGLFLAGVCTGVAVLTKYQAALFILPFAWAIARRTGRRGRGVGIACFLFGSALIVGAAAAALAAAGLWSESAAVFRYLLAYAKGPAQNDGVYVVLKFVARTLLVAGCGGLLWWSAFRGWRRLHDEDAPLAWLFGGWFLAGCLGILIGGRVYFHYYYLVLPPLALLAGMRLAGRWGKGWSGWRGRVRAAWAVWSIFWVAAALGYSGWRYVERGNLTTADWMPAARLLAGAKTAAGPQTLFVWGYCPQLYTVSGLSPATRFTTADYLTGRTPKTAGLEYDPLAPAPSSLTKLWNDFRNPRGVVAYDTSANIFPRAWDYFREDFARRLPDFIVDTSPANYRRYGRYPVKKFPLLHSAITQYYTQISSPNGYEIFQRTDQLAGRL